MPGTVLIAGASGIVGYAVLKHLNSVRDCDVIALSRHAPRKTLGARFVSVDLRDPASCATLAAVVGGVTHVVYAALYESPQLIAGWRSPEQIGVNAAMFRNLLDVVLAHAPRLRHVTLLQGTKAYGVHVRAIPIPAREDRDEMYDEPNFYWEQENYLKERNVGAGWSWTVLRPQVIVGESSGSAMNLIPAIGTYAAILDAAGEPLHYPGGNPNINEAVDADLLARAIAWAQESPSARAQAFNITNGDCFLWHNVWPAIADALGMRTGQQKPQCLAETMPSRAAEWDRIRAWHRLVSPDLESFVGLSFQYADSVLGYGDQRRADPGIVSTVKIKQAGFTEVMDTEAMFRKWFRLFQEERLLPMPGRKR